MVSKKEINDNLKEISKIVCIEMCMKFDSYNECKKCNFMKSLTKLIEKVL